MEQSLISPLVLLAGAILALAGLVLAVRLLNLSASPSPNTAPSRTWLRGALLILAIASSGIALPLLGMAWARLFRAPPRIYVWGLLALGALQMAAGIALLVVGHPDGGTLSAASRLFRRWALPALVLVAGVAWIWIGLASALVGAASERDAQVEPAIALPTTVRDEDDGRQTLIGIVRDGEFWILAPTGSAGLSTRLTHITMQESVPPESREIDLRTYEGAAILVRGQDGGGWIYAAEVIDRGGPLLTELASEVFRPEE
jgi:hypothetical protein